jgi:Flp pilus assembly protein TadG
MLMSSFASQNKLRARLGKFRRDERGATMMVFGLSFIPVMLMFGASIDIGLGLSLSSAAQSGIDAAVISAVSVPAAKRDSVADNTFRSNVTSHPEYTITNLTFTTNADGTYTGSATLSVNTAFMQLGGIPTLSVTRTATAQAATTTTTTSTSTTPKTVVSTACILTLDPTRQNSYDSISDSTIVAPNCEVHVLSTGSVQENPPRDNYVPGYAAFFESASNVHFKKVCVNGPIGYRSASIANAVPYCTSTVSNPFANALYVPTIDTTNAPVNANVGSPTAGVYLGNTSLSGKMGAGLYIFKLAPGQTSATVTLNGSLDGTAGVTLYFADEGITINSNGGNFKLYAPSSGPTQGVLIYMPDSFSNRKAVSIQSLDKTDLHGLIYTPNWNVEIHSWSETTSYVTWVTNTMRSDSESAWSLNPGPLTINIYSDGTSGASNIPATTTTTSTTTTTRPPTLVN